MKLKISIGETYDPTTHRTLLPNDDSHPYSINSKNFTGRICIRIRDFEGITPSGTTKIKSSPYFEGNYDKYSIQVQGRFKGNSWSADDIVFGVNIYLLNNKTYSHEIITEKNFFIYLE